MLKQSFINIKRSAMIMVQKQRQYFHGIAASLFFCIAATAAVPEFRYSGSKEERALLNNPFLLRFGGNFTRCALAMQKFPEGDFPALLVEGSSPAGKRENILMGFSPDRCHRS